jgi:predicted transcriptional regulator of viral defense system
MQPMNYLVQWLIKHADQEHCLFTPHDLRALCPDLSDSAFKTLLSRTASAGHLNRLCRGLYLFPAAYVPNGLILFHAAALLRADEFNYISLETILSDAGIISQIPMSWISIMSSGRSNIITCDNFGTIEFVHTRRKPEDVMQQLVYDTDCRLWRATIPLALTDMKLTHRNCDLIDWDLANEFIR